MASTTKGYPYPSPTDATDVPYDIQQLADAVDASPGVSSLSQTQINALSSAQKWAGRIVWNQTTSTLQRCNGSTFVDLVIGSDSRLSDTRTPTDNTVSTAKIVDGAVTSAKIADGTIVNADINASAAIDPSKISGLEASLAACAPLSVSISAQTASYTLVLADAGKLVEVSNASANTLTIPTNASVAFPVGTTILVVQTGAGQTTIAEASGVTVNGTPGLKLRAQWSAATLIKRATNTWLVMGDVVA